MDNRQVSINIIEFITEYFWLFFILGILAGIFLPAFLMISPYILYMLMFVLFLSCLKIDTKEVTEQIKDFKLVIYLVSLILILSPLLIYPIFKVALNQEYSLAILILLAMPTGMSTPVYAAIVKANKELSLILAVITSLLSPFTIPIMIFILSGVRTNINIFNMFISLSMIIFIPFIGSIIFRKIGKNYIKKTVKYYSSVSILIISLIMAGALAKSNALEIIKGNGSLILPFLSLIILAVILHLFGYLAVYKKNHKIKISSSLAIAYMNSTLAIVFTSQFFGPLTLLFVALYQIPTNIILILFSYIIKKRIAN